MINLPFLHKLILPISLHYDSQAIIVKAKSKNFNEKKGIQLLDINLLDI